MSAIAFREGQSGSGPGDIAPDGSAVELYLRLGSGDVPAIIDSAVAPRSSILDFGCGTGAVAHALQRLGHDVTAVDECAAMLRHVKVPAVLSRIEDVRLPRRYDAVVLASHLLNLVPPRGRREYLRACRDHVREDGQVLMELHDPHEFAYGPMEQVCGDGILRVRDVRRVDGATRATLSWSFGDRQTWTQQITLWPIGPKTLDRELAAADLQRAGTIDGRPRWVIAVPAGSASGRRGNG